MLGFVNSTQPTGISFALTPPNLLQLVVGWVITQHQKVGWVLTQHQKILGIDPIDVGFRKLHPTYRD